MRSAELKLALALGLLASVGAAEVHAQGAAPQPYYPSVTYLIPNDQGGYTLSYWPVPTTYPEPYYWSVNRYPTPVGPELYYQRYYPYTNQFYYEYRVFPRFRPLRRWPR